MVHSGEVIPYDKSKWSRAKKWLWIIIGMIIDTILEVLKEGIAGEIMRAFGVDPDVVLHAIFRIITAIAQQIFM